MRTTPELVTLPPGFELAASAGPDPFAAAATDAVSGADPGRVHWTGPGARCAAAVVLAPDKPVTAETLRHLALLALYDALATVAPPQTPIDLVPPHTVLLDGARVGEVRTAQATTAATPQWAVAGFSVSMWSEAPDPGATPDDTCLAEEGFGDVSAADLLGCFCRHLLVWVDAWHDEGAPGLARAVSGRVRVPA